MGPLGQDHCVNRLLDDYLKAGGICPGGLIEVYNLQYETAPVELCFKPDGSPMGICSEETEESLSLSNNIDECFYETLDKSPPMTANTIFILVNTCCFFGDRKESANNDHYFFTQKKDNITSKLRLNPLYEVGEKSTNGEIFKSTSDPKSMMTSSSVSPWH